jgi:hypothetical protein
VLLYLSHLSQEGEVREGSLNPYLVAENQMYYDAGFRRPALGHYVDLLRKGFVNVEAQETSSATVRMSLPTAVVHDFDAEARFQRQRDTSSNRSLSTTSSSSCSQEVISSAPDQTLINNVLLHFDLTSAIRDHNSKVEMQITSCIQRF